MTILAAIGASSTTAAASSGAAPVSGPRGIFPFGFTNIAANSTAYAKFCGVITLGPALMMNRSGTITGLSVTNSADAATAGSDALVKVVLNASPTAATLNVPEGTGTSSGLYDNFSGISFKAGDVIGMTVTTGAGWTSTTSDFNCFIEVTYND